MTVEQVAEQIDLELRTSDAIVHQDGYESRAKRLLRALDENSREDVVMALLKLDSPGCLRIALHVSRRKQTFRWISEQAQLNADASTIFVYMKYAVPRLGYKAFARCLDSAEKKEWSRYWRFKFKHN